MNELSLKIEELEPLEAPVTAGEVAWFVFGVAVGVAVGIAIT